MSPDIPDFLARGCVHQPAVPWSSFYAVRMAALQRARAAAAQDEPQPLTWASVAAACGADAADKLDILRDARQSTVWYLDGIAEDELRRHLFARWLVTHNLLGETL